MKIKLSIPNRAFARMVFAGIGNGSIIEMRLRKEGLELFDFSKDEQEKYMLKIDPNTGDISWGENAHETFWEATMSEGVKNLLVGRLEQMSQQKMFNAALLPLADYFGIESLESTVPKKEKKKE